MLPAERKTFLLNIAINDADAADSGGVGQSKDTVLAAVRRARK